MILILRACDFVSSEDLGAIAYPELLSYAQYIALFTSVLPNVSDTINPNLPNPPNVPLFFPPFLNDEKMRCGRTKAPLDIVGQAHHVGKRECQHSCRTTQKLMTMVSSHSTDDLSASTIGPQNGCCEPIQTGPELHAAAATGVRPRLGSEPGFMTHILRRCICTVQYS